MNINIEYHNDVQRDRTSLRVITLRVIRLCTDLGKPSTYSQVIDVYQAPPFNTKIVFASCNNLQRLL